MPPAGAGHRRTDPRPGPPRPRRRLPQPRRAGARPGRLRAGGGPARRAVAIRDRAYGPQHVSVTADKAALASILDALGRPDEAEALLRDALAVFEHVFGAAHHEVAVNLHNLASIGY